MKYICFGYYDKEKFEAMTEAERNAMYDACFDYDDHLRANGGFGILEARDMNHAVQIISQHPALAYGTTWEIRPAGDMTEIKKASEQRRRKESLR